MKTRIVADGATRHRQSPEFEARLRELRSSIQARHAADHAAAGFFRRMVIRWRIAAEFRRGRRAIQLSSAALKP